VPCSASLPLPKSSPCKTMPLVFMTRAEREARSSKFYPAEKHCEETSSGGSRYVGENGANPVILAMVRA
jgi:hypothetical protein